jgi:hypothetical protein
LTNPLPAFKGLTTALTATLAEALAGDFSCNLPAGLGDVFDLLAALPAVLMIFDAAADFDVTACLLWEAATG